MKRFLFWMLGVVISITLNAQSDTIWYDSFETFPGDWTLESPDNTNWQQDQGDVHGPGNVVDGQYAVYFDDYHYSSGSTGDLISPSIDLTSINGGYLSFWYYDEGGNDTVEVFISTDNGNNYEKIFVTPAHVDTWTNFRINISSYCGNSVKIKFTGHSIYGNSNPHIDLVSVVEVDNNDLAITDVSPNFLVYNDNNSIQPSITVSNLGSNTQDNFNINMEIRDSDNNLVYNSTKTISSASLEMLEDSTFVLDDQWNNFTTLSYTVKAWVSLTGDENHLNDTLVKTINTVLLMNQDTVQIVDGLMFTDDGGLDQSYSNYIDDTLVVYSPSGKAIKVHFISGETEVSYNGSPYDSLNIYSGSPDNDMLLLGSVYGTITDTEFVSYDSVMTFYFHSDFSTSKAGWIAEFQLINTNLITFNVKDQSDNSDIVGADIKVISGSDTITTLITNSAGQAEKYLINGTYTVITSKPGYLNDTITLTVNDADQNIVINLERLTTTGIEELANNIIITPNPTSNYIHIKADNNYKVELIGLNGRVIFSSMMNNKEMVINVSNLSTGIYILHLSNEKGYINYKVIKH